nr:mitochondrial gtp/gdp carrier protein 1 [Quercus suber]
MIFSREANDVRSGDFHLPILEAGCSNTTTGRFWTTYVLLWRMALLYMINAEAFVAKPLLLWSRASCQVDNYCIEQHSSESATRSTAHFHALVPPSDIFINDTRQSIEFARMPVAVRCIVSTVTITTSCVAKSSSRAVKRGLRRSLETLLGGRCTQSNRPRTSRLVPRESREYARAFVPPWWSQSLATNLQRDKVKCANCYEGRLGRGISEQHEAEMIARPEIAQSPTFHPIEFCISPASSAHIAIMSPSIGGASKDFKRESTAARLLGAGSAGIAELIVFHPVDTIAKRLMSNQNRITSATQLNSVIFKSHAADPAVRRFFTLFPGLGYAAAYKILQRVYKYGGQPFVRDYLSKHHGPTFDNAFGKSTGKTMMHATAGSLIGIGEIVLLPLDVLKIKRQTNPEAFRGRGVMRIVADEGFNLYRGWGWTAARNAPGSFALFGGSAAAKQYLFALEDYNSATYSGDEVVVLCDLTVVQLAQPA